MTTTNNSKVTPAMRTHCKSIAEGGELSRTGLTGSYTIERKKGRSRTRLTYTMGLKLDRAGLVTFAKAPPRWEEDSREIATLTEAGKLAAGVCPECGALAPYHVATCAAGTTPAPFGAMHS